MPPFAAEIIRTHEYFVCRWSELNQLCQILERRTPALLLGERQSGRSSLRYHFVHAAGALLDYDVMRAYYIDLADFPDIVAILATVATAFGQQPATGNVAFSNTPRHRCWRLIIVISRNWPKRLIVGGKNSCRQCGKANDDASQ